MGNFWAVSYNNQNWAVVAEDNTTLFTGDYVSCRKKAFELLQNGVAIKHLDMNDGFDYVTLEEVQAELNAIEDAKKEQREQVLEEIELNASEEKKYSRLVKAVEEGKNNVFNNWNKMTEIESETFLRQAKWLFADPCTNGYWTRALGIRPNGMLQRLKIVNWDGGTSFYEDKHLGRLWSDRPCITQLTIFH